MKFSLGKGALAEDQELVGGGGEDAGVVADEQKRGAALMAQAAEEGGEFQDAGGIQGSEGFIGDDEGSKVADGRKLPKEKVLEIAKGRIWSGQDAKNLGLVDELGGYDTALKLAKKAAGIPDRKSTRSEEHTSELQ